MKQITIKLDGWDIDGKYQWFWLALLDLNDWLGMPFLFDIDGAFIHGFFFNVRSWKKDSTRYRFGRILYDAWIEQGRPPVVKPKKP